MEQGIYQLPNGKYVDLDRILEVSALMPKPYEHHWDVGITFDILYMFHEKPSTYGFGVKSWFGMERFNELSVALHHTTDRYPALLDAAVEELRVGAQKTRDDLVDAWKARKARMTAFEQGNRT